MARCTHAEVMVLLPNRSDITDTTPFITSADLLVDEIVAAADSAISTEKQKALSTYIAAHLTLVSHDQGALAAMSVGESTDRYHNVYGFGFKMTRPGQFALLLDTTGYLSDLDQQLQKNTKKAQIQVI